MIQLRVQVFKQVDSSNRQKMDGCFFQHFTAKCKMDFVLTQERTSSQRFYFKTKRTYVPLKNVLGTFKIALGLGDRYVFMWQSLGILNVFTTLTLKQIFWKTKTFLKKLQYRFLVQSTTNISIPKADLGLLTKRSILDVEAVLGPSLHAELPCQKPILRQIEWGVQNSPITKNELFATDYFIFLKI